MSDNLTKAVSKDGKFRVYVVNATQTVQEAQKRHDTWRNSSAALGRTMIGSILVATSTLKEDELLTTRIQGGGPVGAIVVDADAKGNTKGYITNPHVSLKAREDGHIDVKSAVGDKGTLSITKDLHLKEPFTGEVPLVSGEIGMDFAYYMAKSEQIPSAIGVSVFVEPNEQVGAAGGFLVQTMPGATDKDISKIEANLKIVPNLSTLLNEGLTNEEILDKIMNGLDMKVLDNMPVQFKCDCSKERFSKSLGTLATKDLQSMIDENHGAEAVCKFCNNKYEFSEADLKKIIAEKN
ncbi:Hsp33 family molecular chaperone HslO [Companilactobacillus alimentarius]|uniref:33 kDa chaperonin n=1 Tax=Companilactobacillus alimentarius DSM 20249 TaxID=1423720 RepID=A0A2K9HKX2_9LACO|nr:Hsp33 family molecular chaperone HslO [Companilactobacillus alimentarius]AUI72576.1 Hsp33 family molecular chaperone [Companilactobacillus alimentarius DSM 20249]KRK76367.1 Hsp33-like chaperonin [Companilactobacillus alimentarius DSM 20249]MDT6952303.1 Hsp33 family molecular chaperone HslO [Companilactobacillus alimentarius]GEO45584.1 33 kDa chaperonin [Companilactobacillus alimentarius]